MKIMIIGAHPADPVDLAGGTAYQHTLSGDEVVMVTLTDGVYSHTLPSDKPMSVEMIRSIKRFEFMKACGMCGAEVAKTMGLRDEPLLINEYIVAGIVDLIRNEKPDLLITHHPNEYAHWDHHECGEIVCRALKAAMKLPGEKHWVKTLYFFGVQFRPEVGRVGIVPQPPNVLVDLSREVIEVKIEAMCCFKSQGHDDKVKMLERMNSFEREMGRADGLSYAEGFILGYPLKAPLLPNNEIGGFYTGGSK